MSVLIVIDSADGVVKKSAFETISYGADLAAQLNANSIGVVLGSAEGDLSTLGQYGVKKIVQVNGDQPRAEDPSVLASLVTEIATREQASVIVFSHSLSGKALAPLVSARLQAGLVTGVVGLPDTTNGFVVKRSVFSGKAFAHVRIETDKKLISVNPNSYKINSGGAAAEVATTAVTATAARVTVTKRQKSNNELLLTEAETVVSAGRGLKGPENWGMIEELAKVMGAATACSRPVADAHWRPHNEHVGQTGIAIAPTLYIAIGISGAIQHLAGVNRSKVIVVINKDPEAPFFKAADYGIVGDAFEVIPAFTAAVKKLKGV
ncbi:MAG: electron transfer flavoprotein subunit alpha/FixB family protein [Chitinophagia bacterium]|nr:electron transfer flavoprotein subunit alpha/FixB family protein [Chitinophagia bacterium]